MINDGILTLEDKQKYAAEVEQYRQENVLTKQELAAIREKYKGFNPRPIPFFGDDKKQEFTLIYEGGEPVLLRDKYSGEEKKDFDISSLVSICCSIRGWLERCSEDESYNEKQRNDFKYWERDLLYYLLPAHPHKTMIAYTEMHERYLYLEKEMEQITKKEFEKKFGSL